MIAFIVACCIIFVVAESLLFLLVVCNVDDSRFAVWLVFNAMVAIIGAVIWSVDVIDHHLS